MPDEIVYTAEQEAEHLARIATGRAEDVAFAEIEPVAPEPMVLTYTESQSVEHLSRIELGKIDDATVGEPLILVSATVDETGTFLTLVFNKRVHGIDEAMAAIELTADAEAADLTYNTGAGTTTVVCAITSSAIEPAAEVTLDYDATEELVRDVAAAPLADITAFEVVNDAEAP